MEKVFADLADGLRARGHQVLEAYAEPRFVRQREGAKETWGLPLAKVRTWRKVPTPPSLFRVAASAVRLARCLAQTRPDVVNVHFVDAQAAYFLLLRPLFNYRVILTAHGSDVLKPGKLDRWFLPYVLRRADAIVAVSHDVREQIRRLAPEAEARITVIQNGIDLSYWGEGSETGSQLGVRVPLKHPRIVQVGSLRRVKGQDVLLHALARLRERLPGVTLELVGEGSERDALVQLAHRLGVAEAVTFAGGLEPADVRRRLQRADVSVLPSRSEGLPLALLEAMAAGTPVVATAVGGIPEAAGDPPAALLVPPEDPAALAEGLYRVLTDEGTARALRLRARERVRDFSGARAVEANEALLQRLRPHRASRRA